MRSNGHFDYDLNHARPYANRGSVASVSPYTQDLSSGDMMAAYRTGNMYQYGSKAYCANVAGWNNGYAEDSVDYSLNCATYPVLNQDPSNMVPYPWPSRAKQAVSGSMYVDPSAFSYGATTSLVHRPAVSSDSPNFSMTSFVAALPSSGADRLLPTPVNRTITGSSGASSYRADGLPTVAGYKTSGGASSTATSPTSPISEVTTGGYASSVQTTNADGSPMSAYPSAASTVSSHHRGSYASSDVYGMASGNEGIFSDQERGIGSQGPAVDLTSYTYGDSGSSSLRRESSTSTPASGTGVSAGPAWALNETAHHHHAVAGVSASSGYATEAASSSSGCTKHADHKSVSSRR